MRTAVVTRRGAISGSETLPIHPQPRTADDLLDNYVLRRIEFHARRVARVLYLTDEERDDVRHDMTVYVLQAARRFDPALASWHTFVCRVLLFAGKKLCHEEHLRRKRMASRLTLVQKESGESTLLFVESIPDEHDPIGDLELRLDTQAVLASLPPRLRKICELLKHKSPPEVAAELGINRNSIYRLIASARRHFEAAGLEILETRAANPAHPRM
jgi:RNA polymerase sigma factor (sigma-70 family)